MTNETINNIKVIKLNSWVKLFTDRIIHQRRIELTHSAKISALNSVQLFVNWIIAPLILISTFGVFLYFENKMTLASGFAWIQAFGYLNHPITWLPYFIGSFTDFKLSMKRIQSFLLWKEIKPNAVIFDKNMAEISNMHISIENFGLTKEEYKQKNLNESLIKESSHKADGWTLNCQDVKQLSNTYNKAATWLQNLYIYKGEFVCIIGEVGSGKSSLLNIILNENDNEDLEFSFNINAVNNDKLLNTNKLKVEKQNEGNLENILESELNKNDANILNDIPISNSQQIIRISGSISYIQQDPWIQNKSVRENILFGNKYDENKYNKIINIVELENDLLSFPDGDLTEIGEKGVNISGGQKARISLARALYSDKDIILMDDPLLSVDSDMKKTIFENAFIKELKGKTRVLVTHLIEYWEKADRIIIMEKGKFIDIGTFRDLSNKESYKHLHKNKILKKNKHLKINISKDNKEYFETDTSSNISDSSLKVLETNEEKDEQIWFGWDMYLSFFYSRGSIYFYLAIIPLLLAYSYFKINYSYQIGKWIGDENNKNWSNSLILVVLQPLWYTFIMWVVSVLIYLSVLRISWKLHNSMLFKVMNAPINHYFEQTPIGRTLNRFLKDMTVIDNLLSL